MYALGECLLHFSVSSASVISGCESRNEKWQRTVDVCAADSAFSSCRILALKWQKIGSCATKMIQLEVNITLDHIIV